jgi:DNA-binding NarL/FixJ family response regulator
MVDDHPTFLQIARRYLASQPAVEIIGEATKVEEALTMLESLRPDVVVTDLALPGVNGLSFIQILSTEYPQIGIVALTLFDTDEHREAARAAGAHGFVCKAILRTDLIDAIQVAASAGASSLEGEA